MPPSILKKGGKHSGGLFPPHGGRLHVETTLSDREESPEFPESEETAEDLNRDDAPERHRALHRTDRFPSNNSTESDCFSDMDEEVDSTTDLLPAAPGGSTDTPDTEAYKYDHMKPESQALLMRPEVLKLRKTTCWTKLTQVHIVYMYEP